LCWSHDAPLAFRGVYATAAIPPIIVTSVGRQASSVNVTRSLYFGNPLQVTQPITSEYAIQTGSLPSGTDPFGWHWASNQDGLIQLIAINIAVSQHESYLGFISGVMFGIAGGALVVFVQEILEPIGHRRRGAADESETKKQRKLFGTHVKGTRIVGLSIGILSVAVIVGISLFLALRPTGTTVPTFSSSNNVQPSSSVLITDNCDDTGRIEPASIVLACVDGNAVLENLSWTQWGSAKAIGSGLLDKNNCVPDCASGSFIAYQVDVTLSESVQAGDGSMYFTRITLSYLGRRPPLFGSVFRDCRDLPQIPYIPKCPG
jgi:hypothetical protein